jgi:hypothetical protein
MTPPDLHVLANSDASVLPSVHVETLAVRNKAIWKLCQPSGSAVSPTACRIDAHLPWRAPFGRLTSKSAPSGFVSVYAYLILLFAATCSAMKSTLDSGGRVTLTRRGLPPRKIRWAWPSAITPLVTGQSTAKRCGGPAAAEDRREVHQLVMQRSPPQILFQTEVSGPRCRPQLALQYENRSPHELAQVPLSASHRLRYTPEIRNMCPPTGVTSLYHYHITHWENLTLSNQII